ncbi:hypothetical protein [Roseovarius sp.]|uniref:hypothetical protein n=1 Tax=Roseovarius sp. TaxID=1486281 RepID=UPI003561F909
MADQTTSILRVSASAGGGGQHHQSHMDRGENGFAKGGAHDQIARIGKNRLNACSMRRVY